MSGTSRKALAAGYIPAAAALMELEIKPDCLPGVEQFLALAAEMADTLDGASLDDDDAPLASVFRLPDPSDG
jgi:hypothetical protein